MPKKVDDQQATYFTSPLQKPDSVEKLTAETQVEVHSVVEDAKIDGVSVGVVSFVEERNSLIFMAVIGVFVLVAFVYWISIIIRAIN